MPEHNRPPPNKGQNRITGQKAQSARIAWCSSHLRHSAGTTSTFVWGTGAEALSDGATNYLYGPDGLPIEQIGTGAAAWFVHSTRRTRAEIAQDTRNPREAGNGIDSVEWHFFRSPTTPYWIGITFDLFWFAGEVLRKINPDLKWGFHTGRKTSLVYQCPTLINLVRTEQAGPLALFVFLQGFTGAHAQGIGYNEDNIRYAFQRAPELKTAT